MSDNPELTLWGVGTSRTVRPHWAMHELGLAYEIKPIGPRTGETKTAEYTRLNPRQKIPLLQDGDFRIGESAAIVAYLSRMYSTPERALIPESTRDYAAWAGMVLLHRHRARLDQPVRDAPSQRRCARPDLRRRAGGRSSSRPILSSAAAPCRGRAGRRPTFYHGRAIQQRRYPADDVPGLGGRLLCRHLRQGAALSRAYAKPGGLPARGCGECSARANYTCACQGLRTVRRSREALRPTWPRATCVQRPYRRSRHHRSQVRAAPRASAPRRGGLVRRWQPG